ncbi:MAG: hypothetical protein JJU00_16790, partial [Opitutales bacterium]|nr:hypothetical protein [Opitutales bacterium]
MDTVNEGFTEAPRRCETSTRLSSSQASPHHAAAGTVPRVTTLFVSLFVFLSLFCPAPTPIRNRASLKPTRRTPQVARSFSERPPRARDPSSRNRASLKLQPT